MSTSVLNLALRARRSLAMLTAGAGLGLVAALALAEQTAAPIPMQMGHILNTPGKHFMTEHALGMRDGLAATGISDEKIDARLATIQAERDPLLIAALTSVYEDGYDGVARGKYDISSLTATVSAIETTPVLRTDMIELDSNDDAILDAFTDTRNHAVKLGGEAAGEAMFRLMMLEVAHDQLRTAFQQYTGTPVYGPVAERSLEGFLVLTGVVPMRMPDETASDLHVEFPVPTPDEFELPG